MKTTSQVAELTGISIRTLQYYNEIGLLNPSELTPSGYRLYNDGALQRLQQILFYRELGFKLKEIKEILQKPELDRLDSFRKQKELLLLKRNRIDRLVDLLSRLEKGEPYMSFREFDLSEYFEALERFKSSNTDDIIKHWGSVENFNRFIQTIKKDESNAAMRAIRQFGSIEKYTEAMKYNLENFGEIMEQALSESQRDLLQKNHELYLKLTSDMEKDITSDEIQTIVHEIVMFTQKSLLTSDVGVDYWDMVINKYSNEIPMEITDRKYGRGASCYIAKALQYYFHTGGHIVKSF